MRFPEFTDKWKKGYFKDVCKITTGNKNTQDKDENGLYPFYVRSQNIERINSWTFDGEAILTAGDGVGVGKVFHYSIGKIGVHQRVYILSDFKCDGKYLYQYFSSRFYNRVKRMSAKNSVDSVRMEMIADMPLYLPSVGEQHKIGKLLALLDERISTQNKIIEDLKKLKSAIIHRCYSSQTKMIPLSELLKQCSDRNRSGSDLQVLSVSNKYGFIAQSDQFEDREVASDDTSNYKVVKKGMFAYNPARINVGSIALYEMDGNGIVSPMYVCFTTKSELLPSYLKYYFASQTFKHEMYKRLEGSVRLCLTFEELCNIEIHLPSIEQQKNISKYISKIENNLSLVDSIFSKYQQQRRYLLSQMFI
ncbi:restriction endonuclease subunit S [Phocaeicola massiliensis]|uniref:restriction endonuclease subunit S n=2 Tax=Bacteroidales TaxID=171549 RepID=UPI0034A10CAF